MLGSNERDKSTTAIGSGCTSWERNERDLPAPGQLGQARIGQKGWKWLCRIEEAAAHRDAAQMRGTWGRSERRSVKLKLETNSWRSRLEEWRVAREQKKRRNDFKGELQSRTAEQEPEKQSAVCPELESYSAQSISGTS